MQKVASECNASRSPYEIIVSGVASGCQLLVLGCTVLPKDAKVQEFAGEERAREPPWGRVQEANEIPNMKWSGPKAGPAGFWGSGVIENYASHAQEAPGSELEPRRRLS